MVMKFIVFVFCIIGFSVEVWCSEKHPLVHVHHGRLRGERLLSITGDSYISFKGIPYARPPVGYLRFRDARPLRPWFGVRDALKEGNKCVQPILLTDKFEGEEDCLYLNVYTPKLPSPGKELLPVMVWIHGGGFIFGSGNAGNFGPDYLVSEGIVLVTINYRLGPFGFLYMKEAAPGNVGLKDQVEAFRWVQKNIAAFGGDPSQVTIFGESAGGASTHLHMMSPMSKGLFHRALAQSGAAINPWAFQRNPEAKTRRLGLALGCDQEEPEALVDCLREVDFLSLIKATHAAVPTDADRERLLDFIFGPTPDYKESGVNVFLTDYPENLTDAGLFHDVPYMTGVTSNEGLLIWAFNTINFFNETELHDLDSKWVLNVWPEIRSNSDYDMNSTLTNIRNLYLKGLPLTESNLQSYFDLFSDLEFNEGIIYTIKQMAKFNKSPLYLYCVSVDDELNFLKNEFNFSWPGAAHADDLGYLFRVKQLPEATANSSAALTRKRMVRLWTNFAKHGLPSPDNDALLNVQWKPYLEQEENFLNITNEKLILQTNLYQTRMSFWENLHSNNTS